MERSRWHPPARTSYYFHPLLNLQIYLAEWASDIRTQSRPRRDDLKQSFHVWR